MQVWARASILAHLIKVAELHDAVSQETAVAQDRPVAQDPALLSDKVAEWFTAPKFGKFRPDTDRSTMSTDFAVFCGTTPEMMGESNENASSPVPTTVANVSARLESNKDVALKPQLTEELVCQNVSTTVCKPSVGNEW